MSAKLFARYILCAADGSQVGLHVDAGGKWGPFDVPTPKRTGTRPSVVTRDVSTYAPAAAIRELEIKNAADTVDGVAHYVVFMRAADFASLNLPQIKKMTRNDASYTQPQQKDLAVPLVEYTSFVQAYEKLISMHTGVASGIFASIVKQSQLPPAPSGGGKTPPPPKGGQTPPPGSQGKGGSAPSPGKSIGRVEVLLFDMGTGRVLMQVDASNTHYSVPFVQKALSTDTPQTLVSTMLGRGAGATPLPGLLRSKLSSRNLIGVGKSAHQLVVAYLYFREPLPKGLGFFDVDLITDDATMRAAGNTVEGAQQIHDRFRELEKVFAVKQQQQQPGSPGKPQYVPVPDPTDQQRNTLITGASERDAVLITTFDLWKMRLTSGTVLQKVPVFADGLFTEAFFEGLAEAICLGVDDETLPRPEETGLRVRRLISCVPLAEDPPFHPDLAPDIDVHAWRQQAKKAAQFSVAERSALARIIASRYASGGGDNNELLQGLRLLGTHEFDATPESLSVLLARLSDDLQAPLSVLYSMHGDGDNIWCVTFRPDELPDATHIGRQSDVVFRRDSAAVYFISRDEADAEAYIGALSPN